MRCTATAAATGLLVVLSRVAPGQHPTMRVEAPPRAASAELLRGTLDREHLLLFGDSARSTALARGSRQPASVVVLAEGGSVTVESTVRGDVVVVGGDLFVHPGARIDGRAIAIGGGVYPSSLSSIGLGTRSFRDETYDVRRIGDVLVLEHRVIAADPDPPWTFPLIAGIRIPEYTRVDGLAAPWGPVWRAGRRLLAEPLVTYRSHLGAIDPSVVATVALPDDLTLEVDARRATFSNDRWIRSDAINSLTTITSGGDIRNYYRADRAELTVGKAFTVRSLTYELRLGAATERAWSVGRADTLAVASLPWSAAGREDLEKMARPNPPIDRGRISAALLDGRFEWALQDVLMKGTTRVEGAWDSPAGGGFTQATLDASVAFPTFGSQRFRLEVHTVLTGGDAPRQRFAHLGGSSTLPTREPPLSLFGDQLLFVDSRYEVPITMIVLPFVGSPVVTLRHLVGSAGEGRLPAFTQNLGLRLTLSLAKLDLFVDPETRDTKVSVGLSLTR